MVAPQPQTPLLLSRNCRCHSARYAVEWHLQVDRPSASLRPSLPRSRFPQSLSSSVTHALEETSDPFGVIDEGIAIALIVLNDVVA